MSSQISLCRIHDNSVSKPFQEEKGGTLCDEVAPQKAISEDISFFTMFPNGLPNITFELHEKSVSKLLHEA